jgi:hypothetical protein
MNITQIDGQHLICLRQEEALMLLRLTQTALLHGPTALEPEEGANGAGFARILAAALMKGLTTAESRRD